jgi:hypothetical protein
MVALAGLPWSHTIPSVVVLSWLVVMLAERGARGARAFATLDGAGGGGDGLWREARIRMTLAGGAGGGGLGLLFRRGLLDEEKAGGGGLEVERAARLSGIVASLQYSPVWELLSMVICPGWMGVVLARLVGS